MKETKKWLLLGGLILAVSGCASMSGHGHKSGSVVLSDGGKEAHVCLGSASVGAGDKVKVFDVVCTKELDTVIRTPRYKTKCRKIEIGKAEVLEVSDEHYSKIKSLSDLELKQGQIVEKL